MSKAAVVDLSVQPVVDAALIKSEVEVFKQKILTAATEGKWEAASSYLDQDAIFIHQLCSNLKQELSDVMVISDYGSRTIIVSWYSSNEV